MIKKRLKFEQFQNSFLYLSKELLNHKIVIIMDFEELSKHYMEKYNEMTRERDKLGITHTIDAINEAIIHSDMEKINSNHSKILDWNFYVANLEETRSEINKKFSFLHLPKASLFSVVFDEDEKRWRYNGESH